MIGDPAAVIAAFAASPLALLGALPAWALTGAAEAHVCRLFDALGPDYLRQGDAAVHRTATVEPGAVLKGPAIIGPGCFIASSALLRGGCWLDADCIIGPAAELKSSFLFAGSKLAHLNFAGDSVLGAGVNVEAGAMLANYRNERADKRLRIGGHDTGVDKFGALVGDGCRIGANAVLAPGCILAPGTTVARLALIDQDA